MKATPTGAEELEGVKMPRGTAYVTVNGGARQRICVDYWTNHSCDNAYFSAPPPEDDPFGSLKEGRYTERLQEILDEAAATNPDQDSWELVILEVEPHDPASERFDLQLAFVSREIVVTAG